MINFGLYRFEYVNSVEIDVFRRYFSQFIHFHFRSTWIEQKRDEVSFYFGRKSSQNSEKVSLAMRKITIKIILGDRTKMLAISSTESVGNCIKIMMAKFSINDDPSNWILKCFGEHFYLFHDDTLEILEANENYVCELILCKIPSLNLLKSCISVIFLLTLRK